MEDRSVIDHIEDWDDPNATLNDISNLSISDMNTSKTLIPNINPEPRFEPNRIKNTHG